MMITHQSQIERRKRREKSHSESSNITESFDMFIEEKHGKIGKMRKTSRKSWLMKKQSVYFVHPFHQVRKMRSFIYQRSTTLISSN